MIAKLTVKQLAANKLRLVATAFAVVLGVAFLSGTLILTDTIRGTFDTLLARADAGTDAYVRATSALSLGYGESAGPLDAALADTIRMIDGVDQVSVQVSGYAQIVDKAGKAVGTPDTGVLGLNWVTVDELNPFTLSSGRAPAGPGEVAIDRHSAELANLAVGDRTTVLSTGEPRPATIVGIARFGAVDTPGGLAVVLFDDVTAQAVLHEPGQVDGIAVTAQDGVAPETLVARIAPVVGASNEVISGATLTTEHQEDIGRDISQFGLFLTVFALIAVFVGAFIINNTFSIIVTQRTRELALLRAVGATGRQVRRAVLAEAAATGLVASALGLAAGIGVAKGLLALFDALGVDIPVGTTVISTTTVLICMGVGFTVTVLSAAMPARRASRVPPIAALRDVAQDRTAVSKRRSVVGAVSTAAAAATLFAGLNATNITVVGAGAVALFLAVSILGPVLARPFAAALGTPIAKLRGTAGVVARQNAMRNPTRTARTAASLMIGVALVSFLTIFSAALRTSGADALRDNFLGTAIVDSGAFDTSTGLSPALAAGLRTQPGVRTVSALRQTMVEIDGSPDQLSAFDTTTIATLFDLGHIEGDLANLGSDGIAVFAGTGSDALRLGDTLTITFPTGPATFTVRATYDSVDGFEHNRFVGLAAFEAHLPVNIDSRIYLDAEDLSVIERVTAAYPTAKVLTVEALIDQQNGQRDTIVGLMSGLLGMAVLIALLGVANTLALSIHERRRELGLLRAVGMSRAQVRSSVRWESVIIALFGTGLGLAIGTFLTYAAIRSLSGQGFDDLAIPVGSLVTVTIIAVGAGLAGVATALMPARRAARIDILKAIATG